MLLSRNHTQGDYKPNRSRNFGGGAILTESVFDIGGIGQYAADAIQSLDIATGFGADLLDRLPAFAEHDHALGGALDVDDGVDYGHVLLALDVIYLDGDSVWHLFPENS